MRHHGWLTWARIAIDHEADALNRRVTAQTGTYNLLAEFEASLVAVTAVALSLDALYGVAGDLGIRPPSGNRGTRARRVAESLKRGTRATKSASKWYISVDSIFKLRDDAVHFGEYEATPEWHPVLQSNVSPEIRKWRLEVAKDAIDFLFEVLDAWAQHPSRMTKAWAVNFTPSIEDIRSKRRHP
jgi:hypothetical protein